MRRMKKVFVVLLLFALTFSFAACTKQEERKTDENPVVNQNLEDVSEVNQNLVGVPEAYTEFLEVEEKLIDCNVNVSDYGAVKGYYFDGIKLYLAFEPASDEHNVYFAKIMPKGERQLIKADAVYKYSDLPLFSEEMQSKNGYLIIFNNLYGKDLSETVLRINDESSLGFEIKGVKGEEKAIGVVFGGNSYDNTLLVKSVIYGERTALLRCTLPENAQGTSVMIIYETDDGGTTKMPHNISCEILERNDRDILVQIPLNIKSFDKFTFVSKNVNSVEFSAEIEF